MFLKKSGLGSKRKHTETPGPATRVDDFQTLSPPDEVSFEPETAPSRIVAAIPIAHPRSPTKAGKTGQVDFQTNMCKDFYETGSCAFGDSCKFLHERASQGLSAWERPAKTSDLPADRSASVEEPTACGVCERKWEDCDSLACRTLCGHAFCETCFFAKCKRLCAKCGKPTKGVCHALEFD